ncbi:hypothetical protein Back11_35620 [Paenibacillus baekrokdamisoli]|uniref:Uncharacterized protein n=1 Tax=Paenibacillus baekrokdamisoli TaxID=1712516 RepID=A0A3G9ITL8_9BACL|nr:class 1 isoprenoid biosynthesis enzyme [Paenibacillus baekrokdamisoli]BBH22217.1 hypothetical protein Back11_35620 [Paenibacillus baekrokdamisoli]
MSNWKTGFQDELGIVFAEAQDLLAAFPAPLAIRGLQYLDKFNPLAANSTKNYICYLLPFWLQETVKADQRICRRMALANVFLMLYFFIQDDVMDSTEVHTDWNQQLALSNLFYLTFLNIYREDFPSESSFWFHFQAYITEWAVSVATEGQASESAADPIRFAKKAGPLKLASTGMLLLTDQTRVIKPVSDVVDQVLVTLQMVDDWVDWAEDLADGNENSLLAFIRDELQLPASDTLTVEQVNTVLTLQGGLERFAKQALARHEQLLQAKPAIPLLLAFHDALAQDLLQASARLQQHKQARLRGGFVNWLAAKQEETANVVLGS